MKWRAIKKDNPKAHSCFENSGISNLDDFFDTQGMHVSVYIDYEIKGNETVYGDWWYNIVSKGKLNDADGFKTRTLAKTAAHTKAFNLLQRKISG